MSFSEDLISIIGDVMFNENGMTMYFDEIKKGHIKMFHLKSDNAPTGYINIEQQLSSIQENDFEPKIENVDGSWMKNAKKPKKIEYEICLQLPISKEDTESFTKGTFVMLMCSIHLDEKLH